ncbi:MAG: hypothetical protein A3D92_01230 [Bacteroidetes bacterium RIFCSPHIGHO2_02_FULL_44_7]|nr:MAG: hypothetical protein A3D92_01230 [Bacteroidetes bacterium RIFCSPHIGHO2_02_FULL_44_7]
MLSFFKKLFSQEGKVKDPICGMLVDPKTTFYQSTYKEKKYYFCSEHCKQQFDENPNQFI